MSLPSPNSLDSIVTSELKPSMFWLACTPITVTGALKVLMSRRVLGGHLDLEIGFDDVVVAAFDEAMVGIDFDGAAALRDLELDVVEPIARRAADGVHDQLVAGAAGDLDAAGEGLEPERAARRHRQGAVNGLGLALGRRQLGIARAQHRRRGGQKLSSMAASWLPRLSVDGKGGGGLTSGGRVSDVQISDLRLIRQILRSRHRLTRTQVVDSQRAWTASSASSLLRSIAMTLKELRNH